LESVPNDVQDLEKISFRSDFSHLGDPGKESHFGRRNVVTPLEVLILAEGIPSRCTILSLCGFYEARGYGICGHEQISWIKIEDVREPLQNHIGRMALVRFQMADVRR
jgi:hypothetical protein